MRPVILVVQACCISSRGHVKTSPSTSRRVQVRPCGVNPSQSWRLLPAQGLLEEAPGQILPLAVDHSGICAAHEAPSQFIERAR